MPKSGYRKFTQRLIREGWYKRTNSGGLTFVGPPGSPRRQAADAPDGASVKPKDSLSVHHAQKMRNGK